MRPTVARLFVAPAPLLAVLLAFAATAAPGQNLATNPDFHTSVTGWTSGPGLAPLWTDLSDAGGCAESGMALVVAEQTQAGYNASLRQCIALTGQTALRADVRYMSDGEFRLFFDFWTTTNCAAGGLGFESVTRPASPATWAVAKLSAAVPDSANAVQLRLVASDSQPHSLKVDAVYLGRSPLIFRDGFDGNAAGETAPCRWTTP